MNDYYKMYPSKRGGHRPENSGIKMFIIMVTLFPSPPENVQLKSCRSPKNNGSLFQVLFL